MTTLTDRQLAGRERMAFRKDPARCGHLDGGFYEAIAPDTTRKRCCGCGTELFTASRCRAPTKQQRQCLLPVFLGTPYCRAHIGHARATLGPAPEKHHAREGATR
jgi:hypothetical protein